MIAKDVNSLDSFLLLNWREIIVRQKQLKLPVCLFTLNQSQGSYII